MSATIKTDHPGAKSIRVMIRPARVPAVERDETLVFVPDSLDLAVVRPGERRRLSAVLENRGSEMTGRVDTLATFGDISVVTPLPVPLGPGVHDVELEFRATLAQGFDGTRRLDVRDRDGSFHSSRRATLEVTYRVVSVADVWLVSTPGSDGNEFNDEPPAQAGRPALGVRVRALDGRALRVLAADPPVIDGLPTALAAEHVLPIDATRWQRDGGSGRLRVVLGHPHVAHATVRIPPTSPCTTE